MKATHEITWEVEITVQQPIRKSVSNMESYEALVFDIKNPQ